MFEEIEAARERLRSIVNRTPVMTSRTLDALTGGLIFLKCENFQRVGAFKFRGAYNSINQLTPEEKRRGVIAHSSGNHAQAIALAAKLLGVKAIIVMPKNTPPVKKTATRGYGAEIVLSGNKPTDREEKAERLSNEYGYTLIHPSDDLNVIYGAGTAAYELIEDVGSLDLVLAPVGGGGLLSGTSISVKGLCPEAKVIGVEPKNADDAFRSFKAGKIIPSINPQTIADGLRTSLGNNTLKIILENVDDIITVTEKQIIEAMKFLWERMKLVVEPSGAVSLAGLLYGDLEIKKRKVGIIISGGNIDLTSFFKLLEQRIKS
ncbi:MAG: pyridoxal-phosphate dependent enzyme [Candidatus Jordarchaeum sp.]|uniref:pyridoxal-phosphate dependent enzyme n=1 Tax=Candidatus Jordarchaeum sp. TaxID=2823881 RepID=UPI00404991BC